MTLAPFAFPLRALTCAAVALLASGPSLAIGDKPVSWNDLARDDQTTADVLSYGLGLKAQRHSPAKKINARNVAHLVPAWSFSFGGEK